MVERIEQLAVDAQLDSLFDRKCLRDEHIRIGEVRSARRIAARVTELADRRTVVLNAKHAGIARSSRRIDNRDESIGIEPLLCPGYGDSGIRSLAIERHTGHPVRIVRHGELDGLGRVRCLKDAIAACAICLAKPALYP